VANTQITQVVESLENERKINSELNLKIEAMTNEINRSKEKEQ